MSLNISNQLDHLFESAKGIISNYEEQTLEKQKQMNDTLREKNDYLQNVLALNNKLEEEKKDFLKVSFVHKWKTKADESDQKYEKLNVAHQKLIESNKFLNFNLDKITEKNFIQTCDKSTQCDFIQIETSKGAKYVLKGNILLNEAGKEIGKTTVISE